MADAPPGFYPPNPLDLPKLVARCRLPECLIHANGEEAKYSHRLILSEMLECAQGYFLCIGCGQEWGREPVHCDNCFDPEFPSAAPSISLVVTGIDEEAWAEFRERIDLPRDPPAGSDPADYYRRLNDELAKLREIEQRDRQLTPPDPEALPDDELAMPGSPEKIEVMARRSSNGRHLYHARDPRWEDLDRVSREAARIMNGNKQRRGLRVLNFDRDIA